MSPVFCSCRRGQAQLISRVIGSHSKSVRSRTECIGAASPMRCGGAMYSSSLHELMMSHIQGVMVKVTEAQGSWSGSL